MEHVFWLIPGVLAGRTAPDKDPWSLATLREAGFGAVLSVNGGERCDPPDFKAVGLEYACVPLSGNAPPVPGDLDHNRRSLPLAYSFVRDQQRQGRMTLAHSYDGKDRTGLFMAYYLMREFRLAPGDAVTEVRRVRPTTLTAEGWEQFAFEVLTQTRADFRRPAPVQRSH